MAAQYLSARYFQKWGLKWDIFWNSDVINFFHVSPELARCGKAKKIFKMYIFSLKSVLRARYGRPNEKKFEIL